MGHLVWGGLPMVRVDVLALLPTQQSLVLALVADPQPYEIRPVLHGDGNDQPS